MSIPVALQLYTVRDDMQNDFEGTLKKVKEMGYSGVEFAGLYGKDPAYIRNLLSEIGLIAVSAHVPLKELIEQSQKTLNDYKEIGMEYIAVPYLDEKRRPGQSDFQITMGYIAAIGNAAKSKGMTLLYHNHDFEFVKIGDKYGLDVMYDTIPKDLLETELDVCWVHVATGDPVGYVNKYAGRAPIVHLKDYAGSKSDKMYELIGIDKKVDDTGEFEFRPLGRGKVDIAGVMKACEGAGTKWVVVEQDRPSMGLTPLECAKASREYLKELGY